MTYGVLLLRAVLGVVGGTVFGVGLALLMYGVTALLLPSFEDLTVLGRRARGWWVLLAMPLVVVGFGIMVLPTAWVVAVFQ